MSSGSQIGGAVGAVVGGIIGFYTGNVAQGVQWGYAIGSAVGGYVDPTRTYGPRLEDASAQTSTVGGVIPFGYGVFTCAGNIIWADALVEHKKTERVGKGGSEKQTTYTYTRSYAIGVCEGVIASYNWIKKNGKLVYAANPASLGAAMGWTGQQIGDLGASSNEFRRMATLYYGTDSQMPDSTIVAVEGVGNVSPFRDLAYIVLENEDLTDMQGAVSQYEFCVIADGIAYATSPPYPLLVVDGLNVASSTSSPLVWMPPLDNLDVASFVLNGVQRELMVFYDNYLPEEVECESVSLNGVKRDLIVFYTEYPPEEVECAGVAIDGTHRLVLLVYENYPPEELNCESTVLNGVLGTP